MKESLILLSFLFAFACADDVTITWGGGCSGGAGAISLTWAATNAEGAFKPDGKNGAMVPCDEFFESCFSFVDANGNVIVLPQISSGNFYNFVAGFFNVTPGVITSTIVPEDPGFGSGFISTAGATYLATGQPFTVVCTNNIPNFKVRSNYFLDATNNPGTNPNYVRTLNTVTDSGAMGFGGVVAPYANTPASFNIGQSMCNTAALTPISYPFPAYGTALPGAAPVTQAPAATTQAPVTTKAPVTTAPVVTTKAPVVTTQAPVVTTQTPVVTSQAPVTTTDTNNVATTDTNNVATTAPVTPVPPPVTPTTQPNPVTPIVQVASQQAGGLNNLSGGAVAGIVIAIIVVAAALAIVGVIVLRRRAATSAQHDVLRISPVSAEAATSPAYDPSRNYQVGQSVMARFSGDGKDYRAVILQTRPGPQYLVQYAGFGDDTEWLPASSLRPL